MPAVRLGTTPSTGRCASASSICGEWMRAIQVMQQERGEHAGEQAEHQADREVQRQARRMADAPALRRGRRRRCCWCRRCRRRRFPCSAAAGCRRARGWCSASRLRMLYWMLRPCRSSTSPLSPPMRPVSSVSCAAAASYWALIERADVARSRPRPGGRSRRSAPAGAACRDSRAGRS